MRDWQDERWIKLYTRDEPEWLVLPWKARGLFNEILKRLDPAGVMRLGKAGRKAIAAALSATWDTELAEMINVLEEDGAIRFFEGETLLQVPNFVEAQASKQSDRARQQKRRARARAFEDSPSPVTQRDILSRDPNQGVDNQRVDATSYDVSRQSIIDTPRDSGVTLRDMTVTQRDQTVTRCHALSRREEKRREEREEIRTYGTDETVPVPPDVSASKRRKAKQADLKPKAPVGQAWSTWRKMYQTSRRKYGKYVENGDCKGVMLKIAERALSEATSELQSIGKPGDPVEPVVQEVLEHWFAAYLRDEGRDGFLVDHRHPIRFILKSLSTYGTPWSRDAAEDPAKAQAEYQRRRQAAFGGAL